MNIGQALVLVLSFPAISALLLGVTVAEARLLGGSAAPPPANQPKPADTQQQPAGRGTPSRAAWPHQSEHATSGR